MSGKKRKSNIDIFLTIYELWETGGWMLYYSKDMLTVSIIGNDNPTLLLDTYLVSLSFLNAAFDWKV